MAPRPLPLAGRAGVRRACAGACFVALLLAGCGSAGSTSHSHGSLHGTVTRGPTTPVCRAGTPCSAPASGAQLVFSQNGHIAARVVVKQDGSYSVSLAPGTYSVTATSQTMMRQGITPSTVSVAAGQSRTVDFQIDTGIR